MTADHRCCDRVHLDVDARARAEHLPSVEAIVAPSCGSAVGMDGMTAWFDLDVNGVPLCAEVWSISLKTHRALWQLVDGLWRLLYRDGPPSYRPYLEHLHTYFRDDLPLRWISPTRVRLFGSLSSLESNALTEAFEQLPTGSTIEMSNFEGMGASLYPLFRLAAEKREACFVVNDAARTQLSRAGVPDAQLIQTSDGPYRTGQRCEVVLTAVDAPARACIEVAALMQIPQKEALSRLKTLPLSLGLFDVEDVESVIDRLRAARATVGTRIVS